MAQAVVFAYVHHAATWTDRDVSEPEYFNLSTGKMATELAPLSDKRDTMLRHVLKLVDKGVLERKSVSKKQFLKITEKGLTWNRERDIARDNASKTDGTNIPHQESSGTNIPNDIDSNGKDFPQQREEHPEGTGQTSIGSVNQLSGNQEQKKETASSDFFGKLEESGYVKKPVSANDQAVLDGMSLANYTVEEFKAAHEITIEGDGPGAPILTYLNAVLRNRRKAAEKKAAKETSTKPGPANRPQQIESTDVLGDNTEAYEAAAARKLEEMKQQQAEKTETSPEEKTKEASDSSPDPDDRIEKVILWFIDRGYDRAAIESPTNRMKISQWLHLGLSNKPLLECFDAAVKTRDGDKPKDPVTIINQPLMRILRESQGNDQRRAG